MKVCTRCIMCDTGDDTISFDTNGVCNYCSYALARMGVHYFPNEEGKRRIEQMLADIKKNGEGKEFDCLMGISGGLDSSYLAYLGYKWGLRILGVHLDDGFDTDIAKSNIEKLTQKCGIRLVTVCPNPEQFYDLTLAFFKASVPNLAIPQDNVVFSGLLKFAAENDIQYLLSGENYSLECILQRGNTHSFNDLVHINDIHKRFGQKPIADLPLISWKDKKKLSKKLGIQTMKPLNFVEYNKEKAIQELKEFCGYEYYEAKHFESVFTRFMQAYYLPTKFHVDKRTSHLSSLIVTGQLSREDALKEMESSAYAKYLEDDIAFIIDKLGITRTEFDEIMSLPPKQHTAYKIDKAYQFRNWVAKVGRKFVKK